MHNVLLLFCLLFSQVGSPLLLHIERSFPHAALHYVVRPAHDATCLRVGLLLRCSLCVKVVSRGQTVSAGDGTDSVTLVPEASWSPLASVLVYAVVPSGEVVSDVIELPVAQTPQNQVFKHLQGSLIPSGSWRIICCSVCVRCL